MAGGGKWRRVEGDEAEGEGEGEGEIGRLRIERATFWELCALTEVVSTEIGGVFMCMAHRVRVHVCVDSTRR